MNGKKVKKAVSAFLLASLIAAGANIFACNSSSAQTQVQQQFTPVQGKVVYVPSGTSFPATATMELSSEILSLGQSVCIALTNDFYYNNTLIAPIGSSVNGTVIYVKKSGQAGINGELKVKFTNIVTPYGQMIPISGKIKTEDGTGMINEKTKIDSSTDITKDITAGAAAGAVAGTIFGPLSDSKSKRGEKYGIAAGASATAVKSIWDKGIPAVIPAGSVINIVLDQQITFTPQQGYQY